MQKWSLCLECEAGEKRKQLRRGEWSLWTGWELTNSISKFSFLNFFNVYKFVRAECSEYIIYRGSFWGIPFSALPLFCGAWSLCLECEAGEKRKQFDIQILVRKLFRQLARDSISVKHTDEAPFYYGDSFAFSGSALLVRANRLFFRANRLWVRANWHRAKRPSGETTSCTFTSLESNQLSYGNVHRLSMFSSILWRAPPQHSGVVSLFCDSKMYQPSQ